MLFQFHFFGKRLIKTAVAVFITAQICYLLDWPMIFAVITAIVTIEPTVDASIRKGVVRFPAAAVGAAFAMIFSAWLGIQPLTFMLSALSTIYVCNLLRWNHAIIVSTLTAVNMISVSEANYLMEYVVRLGTTITGITVSAVVNYYLFRPNYLSELKTNMADAYASILTHARLMVEEQKRTIQVLPHKAALDKVQTLLDYQMTDIRYNRTSYAELRELARIRQTLQALRRILFYMETAATSPDKDERSLCHQLLVTTVQQLQDKQNVTQSLA